ncbi:MAG: protein kinase [Anaerolineae bacterium]|nr:protein kinase [Anaerolineae bacterium]
MDFKKDELIGKQLGDYQIKSLLAKGGIARIYVATDIRLNRQVAIKILETDSEDTTFSQRFLREARALANLDHPNIVPIFAYGEQEGLYFFATKFLDGQDLSEIVRNLNDQQKYMDFSEIIFISKQVANALDYAHSNGFIHRDIKPSNIQITNKNHVFLTDFGLVFNSEVDITKGTAFGTPRYISPEQAIASEKAVPQSDQYSLAVVLFELLTGEALFTGDTPMQLALSHITESPRIPSQVNTKLSTNVDTVLLRALAKEPEKRYPSCKAFIDALALALEFSVTESSLKVTPYPTSTKNIKLFLSYRRTNQMIVEALVKVFKQMDHIVWYDQHLTGGQKWWDTILEEIQECDLFVPILSPEYLESYPCKLEYEYAHQLNKRILPIEVISVGDYRQLPSQLQAYQIVKIHHITPTTQTLLEDAFNKLKSPIPMPNPLPIPPEAPISELSKLKDRAEAPNLGDIDSQLLLISKLEVYLVGDSIEDRIFVYDILKNLQVNRDIFKQASDKIARLLAEYEKQNKGGLLGRFKRPRP